MPELLPHQIQALRDTRDEVDRSGTLVCPDCFGSVRLSESKFGRFYRCRKGYQVCPGAISAFEDGTPKGVPANKATRTHRQMVFFLMEQRGVSLTYLENIVGHDLTMGIGSLTKEECELILRRHEEYTPRSVWERLEDMMWEPLEPA